MAFWGLIGPALEAVAGLAKAYTKSVELQERHLDWQMGVDKAEKEQLKAENAHLRRRLEVYEAKNATPGSGGSSSSQL